MTVPCDKNETAQLVAARDGGGGFRGGTGGSGCGGFLSFSLFLPLCAVLYWKQVKDIRDTVPPDRKNVDLAVAARRS